MTTIKEIVKRRYESGAYGNAHFRMRREDFDVLPREPIRREFRPDPVGDLLSIPVVTDERLPAGQWRLIDNTTEDVLFMGSVTDA